MHAVDAGDGNKGDELWSHGHDDVVHNYMGHNYIGHNYIGDAGDGREGDEDKLYLKLQARGHSSEYSIHDTWAITIWAITIWAITI